MVEERVTVRDDGVTREETIERSDRSDRPVVVERSGGGTGWVLILLLLIAAVAGVWFLTQANRQGAAESAAVTEAAQDVGKAAGDVADSVGNALDGEDK